MEITKREVLFSTIIAAVLLTFGFVIHGKISDSLIEKYQKYDTAVQIDNDAELFRYGMETNIGFAFVYGDLKAVDSVNYSEIGGKYSYVRKITEEYTKHTRTVKKTRTNSKGETETYTETETYWTWDAIDEQSKHCKKISFLNSEFDYGVIALPQCRYIKTIQESYYIRYVYYGTGTNFKGTLSADFQDGTIKDTCFYNGMKIDETIDYLESSWQLVVFWIFWITFIGGCVFGFCYFENRWLDD